MKKGNVSVGRRRGCLVLDLCVRLGFLFIKYSDPMKVSRSLLYLICISVAISSQEAGRYPAYKEMVAEYRWLNKRMYLKFPVSLFCLCFCSVIGLNTSKLDDLLCSSSVANGTQKSSSQGSDSNSSASSLSSGTPVSSLSGLSQVMFPPSMPFGSDMVDVCISTEDQRSGSAW